MPIIKVIRKNNDVSFITLPQSATIAVNKYGEGFIDKSAGRMAVDSYIGAIKFDKLEKYLDNQYSKRKVAVPKLTTSVNLIQSISGDTDIIENGLGCFCDLAYINITPDSLEIEIDHLYPKKSPTLVSRIIFDKLTRKYEIIIGEGNEQQHLTYSPDTSVLAFKTPPKDDITLHFTLNRFATKGSPEHRNSSYLNHLFGLDDFELISEINKFKIGIGADVEFFEECLNLFSVYAGTGNREALEHITNRYLLITELEFVYRKCQVVTINSNPTVILHPDDNCYLLSDTGSTIQHIQHNPTSDF